MLGELDNFRRFLSRLPSGLSPDLFALEVEPTISRLRLAIANTIAPFLAKTRTIYLTMLSFYTQRYFTILRCKMCPVKDVKSVKKSSAYLHVHLLSHGPTAAQYMSRKWYAASFTNVDNCLPCWEEWCARFHSNSLSTTTAHTTYLFSIRCEIKTLALPGHSSFQTF